jgi:uncharacterized protein YcbK (DUF882 family)
LLHYDHYSEVPKSIWRWPDFTPFEIRCRGTGSILIDPDAMDSLQLMRTIFGRPLTINSAYRSPLYNARVGGAPMSTHKLGKGFDIALKIYIKDELHRAAVKAGFQGFGLNYRTFIHVDKGGFRTW